MPKISRRGGSHPSRYSDLKTGAPSPITAVSPGLRDCAGPQRPGKKAPPGAEPPVAILNAPAGYLESLAPAPADLRTELQAHDAFDAVQLFVNGVEELKSLGPAAIRAVKPDGLLWITCPKGGKTRGVTDLPATPWWVKRDVLGEITSETGYRPVAFVKIDDSWTALRFKGVE
jgi:hypothetical protein